ncbi:MAG: type I methionyl aminopeptidase [Candidatus Magasanikbacteria bacterium CG10_big_fil_rev_8_21_14_0_10_36_32]|uniref:Methionine aminopeptidase n=1 Tax=Candidatus Magasanikbacteria bacterium CG10_big_fil_rev_8_21_14_0_10_36_32 TaxID=1974646 RepID=A0A2M6W6M3_9BACT|nr:MAG: type I methionyl aminopeptidase [Candidatus Magasanikbacteria bacterium CG10_big_fil_rev_8_21_14_0_10_36_32]
MLIKTTKELEEIRKGGKILGQILSKLAAMCKPGVSTWEIDQAAEKMIIKAGGKPSFKGYSSSYYDPPFPATICASLNQELVHGIAKKETVLHEGDLLSIDIGMEYPRYQKKLKIFKQKRHGFFTDTSITVLVGVTLPKIKELVKVTKEALECGIRAAQPGNSVADIGRSIENYVRSQGNYGIVRDLVGHGVGHAVHEEPRIPNYFDKKLENVILQPGMVLALEPMISLGSHRVKTNKDGWTIEMADKSICAHFEHTIIIKENGPVVVTRRPGEIK